MGQKIDEKMELVYNFVTNYVDENGFPPSVREICSELSIKSTATTYYYLEKLQERGLLKKTKSKNRALEVVNKKDNIKSVPLVGKITAGEPILATENIEENIPLPSSIFNQEDLFMLTVQGYSMIEAGIFDGDKIIVKLQKTAVNGEIVVAMIDSEATVKRYYKHENYYILHPENKSMNDIKVTELDILGIVTGLIRKF